MLRHAFAIGFVHGIRICRPLLQAEQFEGLIDAVGRSRDR